MVQLALFLIITMLNCPHLSDFHFYRGRYIQIRVSYYNKARLARLEEHNSLLNFLKHPNMALLYGCKNFLHAMMCLLHSEACVNMDCYLHNMGQMIVEKSKCRDGIHTPGRP